MSKFTKKQIENIRTSVESYMDFKVRDMMDEITDSETDGQIFDTLDEGIGEKKFFNAIDGGNYDEFPEEEIKTLVKKLTDSYMNMFK